MHITIEETDNQGDVTGITSITFDDIHTITAQSKLTGSGKNKREFTLHRKSDIPYILDPDTTKVIDSPPSYNEWISEISKALIIK